MAKLLSLIAMLIAFSAHADSDEIKSSWAHMEECEDRVFPKVLEIDVVKVEIATWLREHHLEKIDFRSESSFPLPFFRVVRDLLLANDPNLIHILNVSAGVTKDPTTGYNVDPVGDILSLVNLYVYPVYQLKIFEHDLNDVNLDFFARAFRTRIARVGNTLPPAHFDKLPFEFHTAMKEDFAKDVARWVHSKRTGLAKIVADVEEQPAILRARNESVSWALRISQFVRETRNYPALDPEDATLLAKVDGWHPEVVPKTATKPVIVAPVPKPTHGFLERLGLWRPEPKPLLMRPAKLVDVDLDSSDPAWIFAEPMPRRGGTTYLEDRSSDSIPYARFRELADFGRTFDFYRQIGVWWKGGPAFSNITGLTSRGLPAELRGQNFKRNMFWPGVKWGGVPLLDKMRIAETVTADDKPLTLELSVSRDGLAWSPLYFHREGAFWVRDFEIQGRPVLARCMECHVSDGRGKIPKGEYSPRTYFMNTVQHFLDVGYTDLELINRFLEY